MGWLCVLKCTSYHVSYLLTEEVSMLTLTLTIDKKKK